MPLRPPLPTRSAQAGAAPLLRLFAVNGALGVAFALLVLGVLLAWDVASLWRLTTGSGDGLIALALLAGGLSVTFGGAAIATAVMLLREDDEDGPGGPGRPVLRPVPVRRDDHRRRR